VAAGNGNAVSLLGDAKGGDSEQSIDNETSNEASNDNETAQVNAQSQTLCA
jgi:hypothetical protein